jgi:hypothetical protein
MIKSGDLEPNESQRIKLDNHIRYKVYQMQLPLSMQIFLKVVKEVEKSIL